MNLEEYQKDWAIFRNKIEQKAKNRCFINNKNWQKLRSYHFDNFVKTIPEPYFFVFKMVYLYKMQRNIPSIMKVYYKYKKRRIVNHNNETKTTVQAFKRYR